MLPIEFDRQFFHERCRLLCGIDEAGRGPLAGPVVAAAVMFDERAHIEGVCDSKKLSPSQREILYAEIMNKAAGVGVGIVGPGTIDRINILAATHLAAGKALLKLSLKPDLIITDYLKLKHTPAPVRFFVKGDENSHAIAAASIIAKVTRDRLMLKYHVCYPHYNFAGNKGYGTKEHLEALLEFGPCLIHRLTFRGVTNRSFI